MNGKTESPRRFAARHRSSLDGIHATFTAQALIADEFIKAINAEAGAELVAPLSAQRIRAVLRSDRLVFHDPASPPPPLGPMFSLEAGDSVSGLTSP